MNFVGKKAAKRRGFYRGLIGVVRLNEDGKVQSKYLLEFKDGTAVGFNRLDEIEIIK